ncbi:MAG: flagellar hook-length control protein FliK [Hyphomicrobiaceae bacterium]|nr:flagellar hook-length control protein FliK [Hyphomicrobiaceae bacterium]
MSRTGSLAAGPIVPAETPKPRARAPQLGNGEEPAFPEHVLMLESKANERGRLVSSRVRQGVGAEASAEAVGRNADAERAPSSPLTDQARDAMLMLDRPGGRGQEEPFPETGGGMGSSLRQPEASVADASPAAPLLLDAGPAGAGTHSLAEASSRPIAEFTTVRDDLAGAQHRSDTAREGQPRHAGAPRDSAGDMPPAAREPGASRPTRPSGSEGVVTAKVVRQETHFAPVRLAPAIQIAQAVAAALEGAGESRLARELPGLPAAAKPSLDGPIRVLHVQLQPADLGTVSVRISLEANILEIRVDTHLAAAAELIRRDQGALTGLLRSAGYDVESLTVHAADTDRSAPVSGSPPQQGAQPLAQYTSQGPSSGGQADGRQGGAGPQSGRQEPAAGAASADAVAEPQAGLRPRPRGVYI